MIIFLTIIVVLLIIMLITVITIWHINHIKAENKYGNLSIKYSKIVNKVQNQLFEIDDLEDELSDAIRLKTKYYKQKKQLKTIIFIINEKLGKKM